jgi:hypothetical protein
MQPGGDDTRLRQQRHGRRTTVLSAVRREVPFVRTTLAGYERRRAHGNALMTAATALGLQVHQAQSPGRARHLLDSMREEHFGAAEENA